MNNNSFSRRNISTEDEYFTCKKRSEHSILLICRLPSCLLFLLCCGTRDFRRKFSRQHLPRNECSLVFRRTVGTEHAQKEAGRKGGGGSGMACTVMEVCRPSGKLYFTVPLPLSVFPARIDRMIFICYFKFVCRKPCSPMFR